MMGLRNPNFRTIIVTFEKSHNAENCKRTFCFGILVKKLVHTHGLDHERLNYATCGLKRKSCRLEKKHPHFPITLAYRKCNH